MVEAVDMVDCIEQVLQDGESGRLGVIGCGIVCSNGKDLVRDVEFCEHLLECFGHCVTGMGLAKNEITHTR